MQVGPLLKKFPRNNTSAAAASLAKINDSLKTFAPLSETTAAVQKGFSNFYNDDAVSPFIPALGQGPWILNSAGEVQYDTGGYGMLGLGHNPPHVMAALSRKQVGLMHSITLAVCCIRILLYNIFSFSSRVSSTGYGEHHDTFSVAKDFLGQAQARAGSAVCVYYLP